MARYTLIDGYLDTMRSEIRWRRDLDDLVSEMEDHLYSTVEHLLARGVESSAAQQATLDRFGEPEAVAAVYASTNSGGIAVPTQSTRRAGTLALISAAFWLAAMITYWSGSGFDDWSQAIYLLFSAEILIAGVLGLLAMVGVSQRLGGLGVAGMIGLGIIALGVVASIIAWSVPLWMGLQGIGLLVVGLAVLRTDLAPKLSTLLTSTGFIVGVITFLVLTELGVGTPDSYGDYPVAWNVATGIGIAIVSLGLIGLGVWLRSEEPVEIEPTPVPA